MQTSKLMGQIPLEQEFRGLQAVRSVRYRLLHALARYLPMFPRWRVALHRMRGVHIGEEVFIGSDVFIDNTYPESIVIEDMVTIISRTMILGHTFIPHHLTDVMGDDGPAKKGAVLKKGCYLGAQCIVMPGVTIGENAVVGAGSIVTTDIPPNSVAMGSPARAVRTFHLGKNDLLRTLC